MAFETSTLATAKELEEILVQEAMDGHLVLTATSRLARRVLHRIRSARAANPVQRWETPQVWGISAWIRTCWEGLWPVQRLVTRPAALRLWHEAAQVVPPPEGISPGPTLYLQLQESLDALQGRRLGEQGAGLEQDLPSWRRRISGSFLTRIADNGYVTRQDMVDHVLSALGEARVQLPAKAVVAAPAGLDDMGQNLVEVLSGASSVEVLQLDGSNSETPRGRVFATSEQELLALAAEILDGWAGGERDIAVVPLDNTLFPQIRRLLDELQGIQAPTQGNREIRFNMAGGSSLAGHPLARTALLPFALLTSPRPGPLLSTLLTSPYVLPLPPSQVEVMTATLWKGRAIKRIEPALKELEQAGVPVSSLILFLELARASSPHPMERWLEALHACWLDLGFPQLQDPLRELDVLAHRHYQDCLIALRQESGQVPVSATEAGAWIDVVLRGVSVAEPSPETAGIQVLPPGEALGLSFERLWLVAAHGRVLPAPPRELPLLDSQERRAVAGGSVDEQWELGQLRLNALLASAPRVDISRAAGESEDEPFLPCPFVDNDDSEILPIVVDPWSHPHPAWMRAQWRHQGLQGIGEEGPRRPLDEPLSQALPEQLSVSDLGLFLACPVAGFAAVTLELQPVEDQQRGVSPPLRGVLVHRILQAFVDRLIHTDLGWPRDLEEAVAALAAAADDVLEKMPASPFLSAERDRLLGDDERSGLLGAWLEEERQRALKGWCFQGTELAFQDLETAGVRLSGRVDRVDVHPQEGLVVWDYKTGDALSAPAVTSRFEDPQLPAYLLALRTGHLPGLERRDQGLQAGYIALKSEADVKVRPLDEKDWDKVLAQWQEWVAVRLEEPRRGRIRADPANATTQVFSKRQGACYRCPYHGLCSYFDQETR